MTRITLTNVEYYLELLNNKTTRYYKLRHEHTGYSINYRVGTSGEETIRSGLTLREAYDIIYAMNTLMCLEGKEQ